MFDIQISNRRVQIHSVPKQVNQATSPLNFASIPLIQEIPTSETSIQTDQPVEEVTDCSMKTELPDWVQTDVPTAESSTTIQPQVIVDATPARIKQPVDVGASPRPRSPHKSPETLPSFEFMYN